MISAREIVRSLVEKDPGLVSNAGSNFLDTHNKLLSMGYSHQRSGTDVGALHTYSHPSGRFIFANSKAVECYW
jgi:hypothetical protein